MPEIAGCDRIADARWTDDACPWGQPVAFKVVQSGISGACWDKDRLIPRVIELKATTPAGALAKALVVAGLFDTARGQLPRRCRPWRRIWSGCCGLVPDDQ